MSSVLLLVMGSPSAQSTAEPLHCKFILNFHISPSHPNRMAWSQILWNEGTNGRLKGPPLNCGTKILFPLGELLAKHLPLSELCGTFQFYIVLLTCHPMTLCFCWFHFDFMEGALDWYCISPPTPISVCFKEMVTFIWGGKCFPLGVLASDVSVD